MRPFSFVVGDDGRLPEGIRQTLQRIIPTFAGKRMTLELREHKDKRSLAQNSYWFAMLDKYVTPVFRESGSNWDTFGIHEHIMRELGYTEVMVLPNGKISAQRLHSSDFSTEAWEEFMARGRAFVATEYQIFLPLPNEDFSI